MVCIPDLASLYNAILVCDPSVMPASCLQVPPLRVRPADILDFERYYMRVISKEQGVKLTLTQEAERALLAYSFPENVEVRLDCSPADY